MAKRGRPIKDVRDFRNERISFAEARKLLDMPESSFELLVEQGIIPRTVEGDYLLGEVVDGYFSYLSSKEGLNAARTRLTLAKAEITEAELAEIRGQLHKAGAVMAVWNDTVMNMRSRLLSLPTALAPECEGLTKQEIQQKIKEGVYDALNELSEYNAKKIQDAGDML